MIDSGVLKWGALQSQDILSKVIKTYDPEKIQENDVGREHMKPFITGSIYAGQWSPVDMEGIGTYILPHGVVYEGFMKNGTFHGKGILIYPCGQVIIGEWFEGGIVSWKFRNKDVDQGKVETYCRQPDRRFLITRGRKLRPAGRERLTNRQPTIKIPPGCYDVIDGFYNPKTYWVHSNKKFSKVLYMPAPRISPVQINVFRDDGTQFIKTVPFVPIYRTSAWIEEHCRKEWDQNTYYKPELYEYWFSGSKKERNVFNMRVQNEGGKFVSEESDCEKMLHNFEKIADNHRKANDEIVKLKEQRDKAILFDKLSIVPRKSTQVEKSSINWRIYEDYDVLESSIFDTLGIP